TLVEGDDKPFARIKILTTLRDALRTALEDGSFMSNSGYVACGKRLLDPGRGRRQAFCPHQDPDHAARCPAHGPRGWQL
ncbi:MAG TPA: hypothetical protein VLQ88_06925, partial [Chromatiaceae bacterium]|nr:hypothetical protein [Chromatiaceae bacterium]